MLRLRGVLFSGISAHPSGIFLLIFALLLSFFSVDAQVTVKISSGGPDDLGHIYTIAYGNGIYVAVRTANYPLTSTDGIHFEIPAPWVPNDSLPSPNDGFDIQQVVFANGIFVGVGSYGLIRTSTDGINWNELHPIPSFNGDVASAEGLTYGGGQWMAILGDYIVTSPDAITWTVQATGYPAGITNFVGLVYKDGKYIIGATDGQSAYLIYSGTGIGNSWTKVTIVDTVSGSGLASLQLLNNTLYAFTSPGINYTSDDITHWAAITDSRLSGTDQPIQSGVYANGTYYLYGYQNYVYTSQDEVTWTVKPQTRSYLTGPLIYANGFFYLTAGYTTAYSTDAVNWALMAGDYAAICTNGSLYVMVGSEVHTEGGIYTSSDWSGPWANRILYNMSTLNAVTYGDGKFVAIGNQDTTNMSGNFATSPDGITWTAGYIPISYNLRAIAFGDGKFVAVGSGGGIYYSSDARNWTQANTEIYYDFFAISYLNGFFVAVGGGPYYELNKPLVKYSADGITWTDVSPNIRANSWGIAYGEGKYVLVGGANAGIGDIDTTTFWSMTTTDITNVNAWSAPSFSVTPFVPLLANLGWGPGSADYPYMPSVFGGLAYGNGQFVAVSELAPPDYGAYVLNSSDGINWTATKVRSTDDIITDDLKGIIYTGSNTFKAVGSNGLKLDITAGAPVTLPLTLLSFTGRQEGDKNILSWQTSDEVNTKEFVIEWSADGHTYLPIGTVPAASHSTGKLDYSYTHEPAPVGNDLYRLRMVDLDGNFTYSNIVLLKVSGNTAPLTVWPNPVRDGTVNIGAPSTTAFPLTCTVYDANGKMVQQVLLTQLPQTIDVSGLSRGTYTLRFSNGVVKKLIRL